MIENTDKTGAAARIAALRAIAEVSARALSRAAGLASGHVGLIEKRSMGGKRGLEGATLTRLARALGCSPEYLRDGKGDAPAPEVVKRAVTRAIAKAARARAAAKTASASEAA